MEKSTREFLRILLYVLAFISLAFTIDFDSIAIGRWAHGLLFFFLALLSFEKLSRFENMEVSYWRAAIIVVAFLKIIWQTYKGPSRLQLGDFEPYISIAYQLLLMFMVILIIGIHRKKEQEKNSNSSFFA